MEIYFTYNNLNLMIIMISIVVILYILSIRTNKKRVITFGNYETLQKVVGKQLIQKKYLLLFLRLMAIILIVLGLSEFTIVLLKEKPTKDIVLTIDASSSMLTSDFEPTRLEAAKELMLKLTGKIPKGTKIGIITFAGKPRRRLDLTDDYKDVADAIKGISNELPAGTAITDALAMGGTILSNSKKGKLLVLITDGINNIGLPINSTLDYMIRSNITVDAIGIGSFVNESNITNDLPFNATRAEFPNLDEENLNLITNMTGGKYIIATNNEELEKAFDSIKITQEKEELDFSYQMLLLGVALLMIEWAFGITKYESIP